MYENHKVQFGRLFLTKSQGFGLTDTSEKSGKPSSETQTTENRYQPLLRILHDVQQNSKTCVIVDGVLKCDVIKFSFLHFSIFMTIFQ